MKDRKRKNYSSSEDISSSSSEDESQVSNFYSNVSSQGEVVERPNELKKTKITLNLQRINEKNFLGEFTVDPLLLEAPPVKWLIRPVDPHFVTVLSKQMEINPYAITAPLVALTSWGI
jgi:hypothetical protein